jgi:hypothetical protein
MIQLSRASFDVVTDASGGKGIGGVCTDGKSFQNEYLRSTSQRKFTGKRCLLFFMHFFFGMRNGGEERSAWPATIPPLWTQ